MVKGCKKNVVYVKNTGSEMFEEAYFILSDKAQANAGTENDMVREAGRLIAASPVSAYFSSGKARLESKKSVNRAAWFMLGACVMTALNAIIFAII